MARLARLAPNTRSIRHTLLRSALLATTLAAASMPVLAAAAAPLAGAAAAPDGFLYGTVRAKGGATYTGFLRWGNEEAFWDDHFNGSKVSAPATGELPEGYRHRRRKVEVFGLEIAGPWDHGWAQRQLAVRFGDLAEIRPAGDDRADLVFKNGRTLRVHGGSNDFGAEVRVTDASLGAVELEWGRIESVRFAAAPAGARPPAQRLRARVETSVGQFSGWLAWDGQESTTVDELDGETEDGDLSIEMGRIRKLERKSRSSTRVTLADGRTLELSGSNDVDESIRGVQVEDPRFGRVSISWEVFVRAEIEAASDSGRGYDDFPALGAVRASVTTTDGRKLSGPIAYDLDETERWEMIDGTKDDVEYHVVLDRVREIRPLSQRRTDVVLDDGTRLALEGQTDVDESNAGVAILSERGTSEAYVPWSQVASITLER